MRFEDFYLNEMIVIGKPQDKKYIVAFDKWIWIIDDESKEELKDIAEKLKMDYNEEDVYSFLQRVSENYGDVLVGQISGKNLYFMDYGSFKADPKSSILVKKVVNQLKLNSASYIEDFDSTETKVTKKKMIGKTGSIAYHGTSSIYFERIMKYGIKSAESDSNYSKQGIYHNDLVFFATRFGEALHHSTHTANEKGGTPIVIEFKIPDPDAIVADFDVEKLTGSDKYYTGMGKDSDSKSYNKDPDKLSKMFGVYGYKGRIPASFINKVYVATKPVDEVYSVGDFKKMTTKNLLRQIEMGYLDY
jgi:hypothetical protein